MSGSIKLGVPPPKKIEVTRLTPEMTQKFDAKVDVKVDVKIDANSSLSGRKLLLDGHHKKNLRSEIEMGLSIGQFFPQTALLFMSATDGAARIFLPP